VSATPADDVTGEDRPSDGFPRERFTALVRRFPNYARLAWRLGRDERLTRARRAALLAGAAYLVSPIDLVPGFIPVAGQLDDAVVVLLAIRHALTGLPPADRETALAEAGLDARALDDDLRTIMATYAWMGRQGARFAMRTGRAVAGLGTRLGRSLATRLRREA
jgi:uncharacterized membrane protein YkvA (DUF1232 family)